MNYRHIYHAGNACDVVKHAALALVLDHITEKDKPLAILDTHAGCGLYDLTDERAQKTGEAEEGILRLLSYAGAKYKDELKPYFQLIHELNPDGAVRHYPGSPWIARRALRAQDRMIACDLHPTDAQELRSLFREDKQVQVHTRDGYEALSAFLPFPEKRGLVMIDPPFETTNELDRLVQALKTIKKRMAQASVIVWYPIKDRAAIWRFHEGVRDAQLGEVLVAEFMIHPETRADRLNGTGLLFLNAPWKLDEQLSRLFAFLHPALATPSKESFIGWLDRPEEGR